MYRPKPISRATPLWRVALLAVPLLYVLGTDVPAHGQNHIITWGANAQEWNRQLGVDALRLGCSGAPVECLNGAERLARAQGIDTVFLSILLNPARAATDAGMYSHMSLSHPILNEVGFDDFVSQCQKQKMSFPALSAVLLDFAGQLKSVNPNLRLGLTLYMDQISSASFPLMNLHQDFRRRVDYIHLYPHYRKEGEPFPVAVEKVRAMFPNARVIGGVYAYDRRDYLPCARDSAVGCSNEEELSLFKTTFRERWVMLMGGKIASIEFYPGSFGLEEAWRGWENPRACRASRRQECIANTRAMRQMVREILPNPSSSMNGVPHYGTRPK